MFPAHQPLACAFFWKIAFLGRECNMEKLRSAWPGYLEGGRFPEEMD
jgi:hypothetical protein